MNTIAIVGGGLGGLLTAAEFKRRGAEPIVLEASDRPGGVAQTVVEDGFLLEPAASSMLLPKPDLSPILDAAGAQVTPATEAAKTRYVYTRGRLIEINESPAALLAPIVSVRGKLRAAAEPFVKHPAEAPEESLLDFLSRRFGPEMGRLGATLMAHGVFAADPADLSARGAFPAMVDLDDEAGSIIRGVLRRRKERPKPASPKVRASVHVPVGGMAGLARTLADYLGTAFVPNTPVKYVKPSGTGWVVETEGDSVTADMVVLAVPPHQARSITPPDVAEALDGTQVAPVVVVGIGAPASDLPLPEGFGVLVGPDSGFRTLGVLFESAYAPGRAPEGFALAKGIFGGSADPAAFDLADDALVELLTEETSRIVGTPVRPTWSKTVRTFPGIPQYRIGHAAWLRRLDEALGAHPGLHVAGWGYRGIGVSGLAKEANRLATLWEQQAERT